MIGRQARQLGRLVDDLLDIARISRGYIEMRKQRIDLNAVVAETVEAGRMQCEDRGLEFSATLAGEPLPIDGDATRVVQAIGNLLNNACKFTRAGGRVELVAHRDGDEARRRP